MRGLFFQFNLCFQEISIPTSSVLRPITMPTMLRKKVAIPMVRQEENLHYPPSGLRKENILGLVKENFWSKPLSLCKNIPGKFLSFSFYSVPLLLANISCCRSKEMLL